MIDALVSFQNVVVTKSGCINTKAAIVVAAVVVSFSIGLLDQMGGEPLGCHAFFRDRSDGPFCELGQRVDSAKTSDGKSIVFRSEYHLKGGVPYSTANILDCAVRTVEHSQ